MDGKSLILISGKARAGKDTFALGLDGYTKFAFADQLKKFAIQLGWDGYKNDRGRKFLQAIGSIARDYNSGTWVNLLCKRLEQSRYPSKIAITDCRYLNEMRVMKEWGKENCYTVTTVRIVRPDFDNGLTKEMKMHPSETELDEYPFDYIIINSGTIGELICIASSCFASGSFSDLQQRDGSTYL